MINFIMVILIVYISLSVLTDSVDLAMADLFLHLILAFSNIHGISLLHL